MKLRKSVSAVGAVALLAGAALASAPAASASDTTVAYTADSAFALEIATEINDFRGSLGLSPLILDPTLTLVAQNWTNMMAETAIASDLNTALEHNPTFFAEYPQDGLYSGSENILYNWNHDAETTVQQWIDSPGHYANMTKPGDTHFGVGFIKFTSGSLEGYQLATTNFGAYSPGSLISEGQIIPQTPVDENNSAVPPVDETVDPVVPPVDETPVVPPVDETPVVPPVDETPVVPPVDETDPVTPPAPDAGGQPVTPPVDETDPVVPPVDETPVVPPVDETDPVTPPAPDAGGQPVTPPVDETDPVVPPVDGTGPGDTDPSEDDRPTAVDYTDSSVMTDENHGGFTTTTDGETLTLTGLLANHAYRIVLHSTPMDLGTMSTDANGVLVIAMPDALEAGMHRVAVFDGETLVGWEHFNVAADGVIDSVTVDEEAPPAGPAAPSDADVSDLKVTGTVDNGIQASSDRKELGETGFGENAKIGLIGALLVALGIGATVAGRHVKA